MLLFLRAIDTSSECNARNQRCYIECKFGARLLSYYLEVLGVPMRPSFVRTLLISVHVLLVDKLAGHVWFSSSITSMRYLVESACLCLKRVYLWLVRCATLEFFHRFIHSEYMRKSCIVFQLKFIVIVDDS